MTQESALPVSTEADASGRRQALTWWPALLGALLLCAWAIWSGWPPPITAEDVNQHRLNVAAPRPRPDAPLVQTFRPDHDGLLEIELLLARTVAEQEEAPSGALSAQLYEGNALVAEQTWEAAGLAHNRPLTFRFPPQPRSAGRLYTLVLSGEGDSPFSVWAYGIDVYDDGAFTAPGSASETEADELRFVTRYRLSARTALRTLSQTFWRDGPLLLLALALIPLPGCLTLLLARRRLPSIDGGAWWGIAFALGAAVWPLLWQWITLLGGRWSARSLAIVLVAGWLAVLWLRFARTTDRSPQIQPRRRARSHHVLLLLLLFAGLAARLLAIRDLAFLPWVDASRHGLITALMTAEGQAPDSYAPFLPVEAFPYHYGFHTLSTGLNLLSASLPGAQSLPRLLLVFGQLLNALVPLAVYAAGWLLTRRRAVGLLTAFLVAFPFLFPAYYVTWGRLTQLTGVLILAPLLALSWLLLRGARGWRRAWWLVALLAAGLFLVHFRVFLLYLPFVVLAWLVAQGRGGRSLLAAAGTALLLLAPRLRELLELYQPDTLTAPVAGYYGFPSGYLTSDWERSFLLLAGAIMLAAAAAALRGRRRAFLILTLGAWAGAVAILLSGRVPGLPLTWLINLNSAYIVAFLPLALILSLGAECVARWTAHRRRPLQIAGRAAAGVTLAALLLFGVRHQIAILNSETVLAHPADLAGLRWVDAHLPADATVAVNSWQWLGTTWAGSDGGAWLLPLTGRRSTTPPADYIYDPELAVTVANFNQAAQEVGDWSAPAAARWLRSQGVTHIFVGQRGGFFDPAALARNPALRMDYALDGVFVFSLSEQ